MITTKLQNKTYCKFLKEEQKKTICKTLERVHYLMTAKHTYSKTSEVVPYLMIARRDSGFTKIAFMKSSLRNSISSSQSFLEMDPEESRINWISTFLPDGQPAMKNKFLMDSINKMDGAKNQILDEVFL